MPRGRKPIYSSEEERKQAQREHALRYYYRKKALKAQLTSVEEPAHEHNTQTVRAQAPSDLTSVSVKVDIKSKRLGEISEDITYKVNSNGTYIKKRAKTL